MITYFLYHFFKDYLKFLSETFPFFIIFEVIGEFIIAIIIIGLLLLIF